MSDTKILTPLELKVMNILWKIEKGFVKDVLEQWDEEPVPAYNTISTILRILTDKEFVDFNVFGRTHQYYPSLSQENYQGDFLNNALENVFKGSFSSLASAILDNDNVSPDEIALLKKMIESKK